MKNIFKTYLTALILGTLLLTSCGGDKDKEADIKNTTQFNLISAVDNLAVVGSIDLVTMIEKSDFEHSKDVPFEVLAGFKMFVKGNIDAELTGVELKGNNHFALSMKGEEPDYVLFTAKVTNKEKVKQTITKLKISKGEYSKEDIKGKEYEFITEKNITLMWDDKDFIVVASQNEDTKKIAQNLMQSRYIDAPENSSLDTYLKRKDDMNIFVNLETLMQATKNTKDGQNITKEMLDMFESAYYVGSGNFNAGEIVYDMNIYADKVKSSEFNALSKEAVSKTVFNYLTNDKLLAFGAVSLDMNAIFNALNLVPKNEFNMSDIELVTGMSQSQLKELLTGDFSVSVLDIKSREVKSTYEAYSDDDDFFEEEFYSYQKTMPLVVFTVGIKDSSKIGSLLRMSGELTFDKGVCKLDEDAYLTINEEKMILTTDIQTAVFFAQGNKFKTFSLPSSTKMEKPVYGFYNTDVTQMPKGILKIAETEEGQMALEFSNLFESVDFNGDFERMVFSAKLKNKSDNALKVITDFILSVTKNKQFI